MAGVVADLSLPDSRGMDTLATLAGAVPQVPILVIGEMSDEDVVRRAVRHGAQDYLSKKQLDGPSLRKAMSNMLQRAAHSDSVRRTTVRAEVILDSIGDAVVSTDVAGLVTYLNPVAESMTGWSRQEAIGRPLREVLQIIDADTRLPVTDPLARAILEDTTVGLSANCLLLTRDASDVGEDVAPGPARPAHRPAQSGIAE